MWSWLVLSLLIADDALSRQVACTELAFARSVEVGDIQAFAGFLDPDARFSGGGVTRGAPAIVEAWKVFFEPGGPAIRWAPDSVEVLGTGDLAMSQGPYELTSTGEDGKTVLQTGRFMSVWRLGEDGNWSIVFDGGSPPQGAVPGLVTAAREALAARCDAPRP